MTNTFFSPDGLPKVDAYHQVSVSTGSRMVFVAGQVARDADGNRIGEGDLAAQVEQAHLNVATALAAAGGSFGDTVKLTLYIIDWSVDKMPLIMEGLGRAAAKLGTGPGPMPPSSLIAVAALAEPDLLVEIEAIAVLA